MNYGTITKVSGPLVVAKDIPSARLYDTVYVSDKNLLGEIIEIRGNKASIQVYEETSGIKIGEPVVSTHRPLSIVLGPGILSQILDGVGRNLETYANNVGEFLARGLHYDAIDKAKKWDFIPRVAIADFVTEGEIVGHVMENGIEHRIMVPHGLKGEVIHVYPGMKDVTEPVVVIKNEEGNHDIVMMSYWPIRKSRPYLQKEMPNEPLITGQRIIDTFFPVAKGGTACVPGPFGSGKTVVQHQLAKWSNSDMVVYIGCGERGNEITDVLNEFPQLEDPRTKEPLMNKTILIANTSNMPVAAREASIYTGMTIAEYFRDMGYDVSLMADSTSRWAEALREMSGRLEEMPGDEGYPAYLSSRLADVYERAGMVQTLNKQQGSVTMIGAVSPAGGDLSEPVTQATLRIVKVFWALDASLAHMRHFPAIDWLESYSLYQKPTERFLKQNVHKHFVKNRQEALSILKDEQQLLEIVQLVGKDTLSDQDILKLEIARMIREDYLQQNAFQEEDTYTSYEKQANMMVVILGFYALAKEYLIHDHILIGDITNMEILYDISRMKYQPSDKTPELLKILDAAEKEFMTLKEGDNHEGL
ncbi:V-type ATP synthase subunit A [Erysipelothrix sp. HDW6B]|uniref:V-type ATP synthase subunit A n=1 Tax=Erysipelothrix TaxID=1647 RepID=UPI00135857B5|nr:MULTISPECIES: V-type ATP synthase subunit A [Erysipelothrix]QIK85397.1 V-type ATP synthase subunit A [Erysipelothrix sp. HDW6B]